MSSGLTPRIASRSTYACFDSLVARLRSLDGRLFYYADEKALGTPRQTRIEAAEREMAAMAETLNRIARHADSSDSNVMVIIDQVNEKTRAERLPKMYSHILGRSADHAEMRRIIEPPMHVDSVLSANIQFADWIAAFVSRAIDYQLLDTSRFAWISDPRNSRHVRGSFTYESKLHLWQRSIADLHHSQILDRERRLHPAAAGQLIQRTVDPAVLRRIKAAAERDHKRP